MRTSLSLVAFVAVVCVVVAGCGNLSQEDLLFRAAVPQKQAVAVVPPGTEAEVEDALTGPRQQSLSARRQGLEERCDGDLLCESRNISRVFNGFTFALLDIVDAILGFEPTQRAPGRRIWGPHFDVTKGSTFRFEMVRQDDATFSFCLHAANGNVSNVAIDCGVLEDDSGLLLVLSGSFQPSGIAGDNARFGKGTMELSLDRLQRLNGEPAVASALAFAFDQTDGRSVVHVDAIDAVINGVAREASYAYERAPEGDGSLRFDVFADLVEGDALFDAQQLEQVALRAAWDSSRAGRAIGTVTGGNAGDNVFSLEQCWGADLARVYETNNIDDRVVGDSTLCTDAPLPE